MNFYMLYFLLYAVLLLDILESRGFEVNNLEMGIYIALVGLTMYAFGYMMGRSGMVEW
jgi:hypothetical protein